MELFFPMFINRKSKKVSHSSLAVIVTGMEHSGTTFLANILNNSLKNTGGGFECGLLLSKNSPKKFYSVRPFYDWFCLKKEIGHWGFTEEERNYIISTDSWDIAYERLLKTYAKNETGYKIEKLIDKTPAYCYNLNKIFKRISPHIPVLVIIKSLYPLFYSFKKRNVDIQTFTPMFLTFMKSLQSVISDKRLFLVKHESLVRDSNLIIQQLKIRFPLLNLELTEIDKTLNYNLNPLNEDYNLEEENEIALKNITNVEKNKLDILKNHMNFTTLV